MLKTLIKLLSLVALVGILVTTAGCEECTWDSYYEHCEGDTRVWCGEGPAEQGRVKSQRCGSGRTCEEDDRSWGTITSCVDKSLTPCESSSCSEDAKSVQRCTDVGYISTSPCPGDDVCVPFDGSVRCASPTLEPCTAPEAACSADGQRILICSPVTGYMAEVMECPAHREKVCATNGITSACVHESLETCSQHSCAADGCTTVYCDGDVGYMTHKVECCPDRCYTGTNGPHVVAACHPL